MGDFRLTSHYKTRETNKKEQGGGNKNKIKSKDLDVKIDDLQSFKIFIFILQIFLKSLKIIQNLTNLSLKKTMLSD